MLGLALGKSRVQQRTWLEPWRCRACASMACIYVWYQGTMVYTMIQGVRYFDLHTGKYGLLCSIFSPFIYKSVQMCLPLPLLPALLSSSYICCTCTITVDIDVDIDVNMYSHSCFGWIGSYITTSLPP